MISFSVSGVFCLACKTEPLGSPRQEAGSQGRTGAEVLAPAWKVKGDVCLRIADPRRQGPGSRPREGLQRGAVAETRPAKQGPKVGHG